MFTLEKAGRCFMRSWRTSTWIPDHWGILASLRDHKHWGHKRVFFFFFKKNYSDHLQLNEQKWHSVLTMRWNVVLCGAFHAASIFLLLLFNLKALSCSLSFMKLKWNYSDTSPDPLILHSPMPILRNSLIECLKTDVSQLPEALCYDKGAGFTSAAQELCFPVRANPTIQSSQLLQ